MTSRGVSLSLNIPFLDLVAQHRPLEDDLVAAFRSALQSASFVGGAEVAAFEHEFAAFVGSPASVAVNSGTDALRFAYLALGVKPGDEVITVPNTFIATTEALTQAGAIVRFAEVSDGPLTMDPRAVAAAIGPRTVGLVPVHLYGQPADMDPLLALARDRGLWVVEDAAQAHGATYRGRPAGTLGALGAFSFYPGKNLGACGEGGALATNDAKFAARAKSLREHGSTVRYYHDEIGYNYRMEGIQGAVLGVKLKHLAKWTERRRAIAKIYHELLDDLPLQLPLEPSWSESAYHVYVVRTPKREELKKHLEANGVGCALHYPMPLHLQKCYAKLGHKEGDFPNAEKAASQCLSLPIYPELTDKQVQRVTDVIKDFFRK